MAQKKNKQIVRPQYLDRVATINIVKWKLQTTLYPDNMVTLSRRNCHVPSSAQQYYLNAHDGLVQMMMNGNFESLASLITTSSSGHRIEFFLQIL